MTSNNQAEPINRPESLYMTDNFSEDQLEAARKFFCQPCDFVKGVVNIKELPKDEKIEVAFAGRSNVGKSTLINALVNRKKMARTSNTPGRTREINYFTIGEQLYLVDMPGYGYARVSKTLVEGWTELIENYLKGRSQLRRVFLLIDSRHGLKESDLTAMKLMDISAVSFQIVLTKIDKLKYSEQQKVFENVNKKLSKHPAAFPVVLSTSSKKSDGIDQLRASILEVIS